MLTTKDMGARRRRRNRASIRRKSKGRLRLSVFRSGRHIYAQIIDDGRSVTLASASSIDKALKDSVAKTWDKTAATAVGKLIAERAKAAGVAEVVFDRGGYIYQGRIKALAEAAREGGLDF